MGPKARDVMQAVSPNDFSNEAHPFGTAKEIEIGMGIARAHRVTYVGELGWELYVSADQTAHVFEALEETGMMKLCGLHTLDSCRIEKAFRHFGHDITDEDHVLEADHLSVTQRVLEVHQQAIGDHALLVQWLDEQADHIQRIGAV